MLIDRSGFLADFSLYVLACEGLSFYLCSVRNTRRKIIIIIIIIVIQIIIIIIIIIMHARAVKDIF